MNNPELWLYAEHLVFGSSFVVIRWLVRDRGAPPSRSDAPERVAPWSRAVIGVHMVAFVVLYFGIGNAVIPQRVPDFFPGQRIVGTGVIALGTFFACWALLHFKSWRFRAALSASHQLVTDGPFGIVRHPIYLALDLLALGSAIWAPTPTIWAGFVLMVIGSDLRGRTEERLLTEGFGDAYRNYMLKTKRFVPGIY